MLRERLGPVDRAASLIQRTLGNKETLQQLIVGKSKDRDATLQEVASEVTTFNSTEKSSLLGAIFQALSIEGDESSITNRRDGALAILEVIVRPEIINLAQAEVYDMYYIAVEQQKTDNDPYAGSINALLEAGKIIAPYLHLKKYSRDQVVAAWEKVAQKFPTDHRDYILSELEEIKLRMSPNWFLDEKVRKLRGQGFTNLAIAEAIGETLGKIKRAIKRLLRAGRIKTLHEVRKQKGE